jgi:hypothetical protein
MSRESLSALVGEYILIATPVQKITVVADAEARLRNTAAPPDPQEVTATLLRLAEALR